MAQYQTIGPMADDGNPQQIFPCPGMPDFPDIAVGVHAAPGNVGVLVTLPDPVLPQVIVDQPGPVLQTYQITGRYAHSAVERRFNALIVNVPAGLSQFPHGLGAGVPPDMWHADYANIAITPAYAINAIDATDVFIENFGVAFDLKFYGWQLGSLDTPIATSGPIDVSLIAGTAPVAVPHGLAVAPDLILPNHYQPPAGLAPAGTTIVAAIDATDIYMATTAPAGNPLNLRVFAQRTFSVQR